MTRVQKYDSYLGFLREKDVSDIPTFEDACKIQIANPELFDTHMHTRTFVVFGPDRKFKIDESAVLFHLKWTSPELMNTRIVDGFFPLNRGLYDAIESEEYILNTVNAGSFNTDSQTLNREGSLIVARKDPILKRLIGGSLEEYLDAKFSGQKPVVEGCGFPLVWIQRQNHSLEFYASPFRVGSKEYYIAVGEDRFTNVNDGNTPFVFPE